MIKIKFKGVEQMLEKMRKAGEDTHRKMHAAVQEEAERILAEAKSRVPVDTGELRDSGHVVMSDDGRKIKALIEFDAPHAVVVHEDLEATHPQGQAKFLESSLNEAAAGAAERIAEKVKLGK
jgi:hypothetical protein